MKSIGGLPLEIAGKHRREAMESDLYRLKHEKISKPEGINK